MQKYEEGSFKTKDFCKIHKLNYAMFWYWLKKYRNHVNKGVFQQVELRATSIGVKFEMQSKGGLQIRFYEYPSADYLVTLAKGL